MVYDIFNSKYQGFVKSYLDIPKVIDGNTFRIMITTDNHIGYKETDSYIDTDSYENFEEVINICKRLGNVDFMLNSGDLFHDNHFSSKNLNFITDLLVNSCLNDNPIKFKTEHSPDNLHLNYNDENINVGLPIFIVNGNHDYGNSTGTENVSILKILSNLKLINYLGNFNITDKEDLEVEPVILKKGSTRLNLYGLSNIKEERLNKLVRNNQLTFLTNDEVTPNGLNVLLIHQNRSVNINKTYLNENLLPEFFDLLLWGHEHECIPELAYNNSKNFNILQPGSTVQTSFHESELKEKCCFLMDFKDNKYTVYPIPLENTRPMNVRTMVLADMNVPRDIEHITKIVVEEVESMIEEVKTQQTLKAVKKKEYLDRARNGEYNQKTANPHSEIDSDFNEKLPLIRLKLDYTGYELISFRSINNRFIGRVANPKSVLQLTKKAVRRYKANVNEISPSAVNDDMSAEEEKKNKLSTNDHLVAIIRKTFDKDKQLIALDKHNLLDFFTSNLSNSIAESKVNMDRFIRKEVDRATDALVESTKDEIKKVSLRNLTEANAEIHEQPLLAETKDYKKLLKNVSLLMNKQLKSKQFESVKRHATEELQREISIKTPVGLNNKENEDFQPLLNEEKQPAKKKNILSSDSDDVSLINSEGEDDDINNFVVAKKVFIDKPDITKESVTEPDLIISSDPNKNNEPELIVSEDESLVILDENIAVKDIVKKESNPIIDSPILMSPHRRSISPPNFKAPIRRKIQHVNILSSDSD